MHELDRNRSIEVLVDREMNLAHRPRAEPPTEQSGDSWEILKHFATRACRGVVPPADYLEGLVALHAAERADGKRKPLHAPNVATGVRSGGMARTRWSGYCRERRPARWRIST